MTRARSSGRLSVVVAALVGVAAILVAGSLAFRLFEPGRSEEVDRSSPAVLQAIQDLASYKGATGNFQVLVDVEDDVNLVPSFIAGERTLMVANGQVDAEIDFSSLGAEAVRMSPDRRSVEVVLPPADLSATHLDTGNTYVAERQRGLVNRLGEALSSNPGDDRAMLEAAEKQLRDAAAGTDLRQRAEDNTRTMLTSLLTSLGFEQVTVRFEAPTEA